MIKLSDFLSSPLATVSTKQSQLYSKPASLAQKRVVIIGGGFTVSILYQFISTCINIINI